MSRGTISQPRRALPGSISLDEFLGQPAPATSLAERYVLVEGALRLLDGLYVHLLLKRAMYATDPVQRLRLLERRLESLGDAAFHAEMAAIFRSVRDLHTAYELPDPYRGRVATLGILVEDHWDEAGRRRYLVSRTEPALEHGRFRAGVELTAWNGIPIERAVELNAERQAGSNADARIARGLQALTVRPLRSSPPPDERWVLLGYLGENGRPGEARLSWRIVSLGNGNGRAQDPVSASSPVLGVDASSEAARHVKRVLFARPRAQRAAAHALDSVVDARTRVVGGRHVGHLRLYSFNVSSARRFIEQVAKILARLPQDGLIVDIRGNPGGNIAAAEGALQLLAARPVEPARFSLATTPLALELCRSNPQFARWAPSLATAVETGEPYSQALPLSDPPSLADGHAPYPGPTVLITDALSYSAADIFAAGYQDNGLGQILGTAARTGAGGANVWSSDLLGMWLPDALRALPQGIGFRIALRRATRVGLNAGVPLEDLGVASDAQHRLTRRDVTGHNADLLRAACRLLPA